MLRHVIATSFIVAIASASTASSAAGQAKPAQPDTRRAPADARVVQAIRVELPPIIDGVLDDAAWQTAPVAEGFTQSEPHEGQPLTEQTHVRVLYDAENLYFGVYCFDSVPARIIVNELKRDFESREGDSFGVALDPLFDRRNGFSFFTNPAAAKRDAQSFDDGRLVNLQWDGIWHAAGAIRKDGWSTEIVIPFKTLGVRSFAAGSMGINFKRRIRRKNEEGYWSPVSRRFTINYLSAGGVLAGLTEVKGGGLLRLKPFATSDLRNDNAGDGEPLKAGVDAKYRLSAGLALDLTYNTDFSQVEVDTQQINLTRFSLFFPEKREFFLENADLFHFGDVPGERATGRAEDTRLFYTRRIGLGPTQLPVPLRGGARLSGRVGPWSVGLLGMREDGIDQAPANTFTVARVRRDFLRRSDAGFIFVSREGPGGDFNRSVGVDVNVRASSSWTANGFWALTDDPGPTRHSHQFKMSTKWDDGFFATQVIAADIGEQFNPEVGFVPRRGVRNYQYSVDVSPRPKGSGLVRVVHPYAELKFFTDRGNALLTRTQRYALELLFRDGGRFEASHNPQVERLTAPFEIRRGVVVPAGEYAFKEFRAEYSSDRSQLFSGSASVTSGSFYDGHRTSAALALSLLVRPRFTTSLSYEANAVDLPGGAFRADLYVARALYSFDPRAFVDAVVQYNGDTGRVFTNVRFNFTYRPLSDISLVYNEGRRTLGPALPARTLILKLTRLLQF